MEGWCRQDFGINRLSSWRFSRFRLLSAICQLLCFFSFLFFSLHWSSGWAWPYRVIGVLYSCYSLSWYLFCGEWCVVMYRTAGDEQFGRNRLYTGRRPPKISMQLIYLLSIIPVLPPGGYQQSSLATVVPRYWFYMQLREVPNH